MVDTPIYAPFILAPAVMPVPVSLTDYVQETSINEYLFYGVKRGAYVPENTQFYDLRDRQMIKRYLRAAERQISNRIRLHLSPTWTGDDGEETMIADLRGYVSGDGYGYGSGWQGFGAQWPVAGRWNGYYNPNGLKWKHFIQAGVKRRSVYAAHGAVSYAGDWATVTVPSGGVGSRDEVRVYYADGLFSDGPEPSKIKIGPNNVIVTFPKVRLVRPELCYRSNIPLDYDNASNFVETLTIAREYNDPSTQARVRTRNTCASNCQETLETACIFPSQRQLGYVSIYPACYTGGRWVRKSCFRYQPDIAFIHYQSGMKQLPPGWKEAIIRLAHTLMPEAPCPTGHEPQDRYWKSDRNNSQSMTRERINCPWGTMDGAWYAFTFFSDEAENYSKGGGLLAIY